MPLNKLLLKALPKVKSNIRSLEAPMPLFTIFISLCDVKTRAVVVNASANTFDEAWSKAVFKCRRQVDKVNLKPQWLRVDWLTSSEKVSWGELEARLKKVKRNYFRFGLAMDDDFHKLFLEQELNANAMLYGGNKIPHAIINKKNFSIYAGKRYKGYVPDFSGNVYMLDSQGVFTSLEEDPKILFPAGRNAGRRMESLNQEAVYGLIKRSSDYLSTQVKPSGQFHYGWHPCFDRSINAYNTLRHASTTYSMLEAWEVTRENSLKASIDRSLDYLTGTLIQHATLDNGEEAAFLVDHGGEAKLGGNAVCLLALTKYTELTGDDRHRGLIERLALGIRFMQDPDTGAFVHVINYPDLSVKEKFRIIYYEGEAAFGLMRAYGLTGDPRWLEMVEKAFDHFIANDTWQAHDHWLSYCVNELTRYRPEEKYYRFGLQNVAGYLDFVETRITTFPTLLELMMAAEKMVCRIREDDTHSHLLGLLGLDKFYRALDARANHLLNGHFWPEYAMYFKNPERTLGSFFIRHHSFRVRIDDVEHYLSGFVAYLNFLDKSRQPELEETEKRYTKYSHDRPVWTSEHIIKATGGNWLVTPSPDWSASGLCTYAPAMQPGNMVCVREEGKGVSIGKLRSMAFSPAGLITSTAEKVQNLGVPVLVVEDAGAAIIALGKYARRQMSGKVLAVTGSAGKTTTVAMLTEALTPQGTVTKTEHNANLPHGVSWNLASMPWDASHVVLELAVGKMERSSTIARPHVAIFTNIFPAHLGENNTERDIAKTKSEIFRGMAPGSIAILNRDMQEWEVVYNAATSRGVRVVHYGMGSECEFQLVNYDAETHCVAARVMRDEVKYKLGAAGEHMALNSLATIAAITALGYDMEPALKQLENFCAVSGRGEEFKVVLGARRITIIDDSYNANPGSMKTAICNLGDRDEAKRRVIVMGEMADLGVRARKYHTELAPLIKENGVDKVYAVGENYSDFWEEIPNYSKGASVESPEEVKNILFREIKDGDVVLFKGSNSTEIHQLVEWMKQHMVV